MKINYTVKQEDIELNGGYKKGSLFHIHGDGVFYIKNIRKLFKKDGSLDDYEVVYNKIATKSGKKVAKSITSHDITKRFGYLYPQPVDRIIQLQEREVQVLQGKLTAAQKAVVDLKALKAEYENKL